MDQSLISAFREVPLLYAFIIGLVTAIGPCPLSSNVAAVAYVSSKFASSRGTILAGAMYTIGRALTYSAIGLMAYVFGSAIIDNAPLLQDYEKAIAGSLLIIVGLIMLGILKPGISFGDGLKLKYGAIFSEHGAMGAFMLGAIFALAFCPYTAVMFFGLLIPLALSASVMGACLPLLFGIGTGMPVLAFSILLGISATFAKAYISNIVKAEPYVRKALGAIFLAYGAYLLFVYLT